MGCQSVKMFSWKKLEICHISSFVTQFKFLSFVIIWVLKFCHIEFFSFFSSQFNFCHNLNFVTTWLLSQFRFCHNLSWVTILVLLQFNFCHNFEILSYVTIWVFWVLTPFELLSFVTFWVFEFGHYLSFLFHHKSGFWVSLQSKFLSFITI